MTRTPTDAFWPYCVGDDGRFANSARASLAFLAEPNNPNSSPYINDTVIAVAVSNIGDPGYPFTGWVPPAPPSANQGTLVQFVTMAASPTCSGGHWVPGPPPPSPQPYTGPGDSGIVGIRQDEFLPSFSTTLQYGNGSGSPPSIYQLGLTWLDSRNDPAQTNMPCGVVGRTINRYGFDPWSADTTFFGPPQQVMMTGCFNENFIQPNGDRLGRYNESSYQVVDWKYPAGTITSTMSTWFSNGQNFLSPPNPPPGIFYTSLFSVVCCSSPAVGRLRSPPAMGRQMVQEWIRHCRLLGVDAMKSTARSMT